MRRPFFAMPFCRVENSVPVRPGDILIGADCIIPLKAIENEHQVNEYHWQRQQVLFRFSPERDERNRTVMVELRGLRSAVPVVLGRGSQSR